MTRLQWIALGAAFCAVLGIAAIQRPARLTGARATALTAGVPPIAHVALSYSPGTRPVSLIIDITGPNCAGSQTLSGLAHFVDVPLVGSAAGHLSIRTTAAYRVLGRVRLIEQSFAPEEPLDAQMA